MLHTSVSPAGGIVILKMTVEINLMNPKTVPHFTAVQDSSSVTMETAFSPIKFVMV